MLRITSVEVQKKNPHRFNIYLDGKFAFGADEDTVVNFRLITGKEISDEDLNKLIFEVEVGKLMERMYYLFNVRQRSEKEVRDYLKKLSFKRKIKDKEEISEVVVENLIEKLKQKRLINDEEFAKAWIESRRKNKKKGKMALKSELFQKGINREIIEESLQDTSVDEEKSLAMQAVQKKLERWKNLPEMEFKKKVFEFLARRGFDYEVVSDVIEKTMSLR